MTNSVAQILKQTHERVGGLFDLVESSPDLKEKLTLFQQIKDEFDLYVMIEQKILYPALSAVDELSDTIDRSFDEQDEMIDLIEEIDQMEVDAVEGDQFDTAMDVFDDSIAELRDMFSRHAQREENELYPRIEQVLPKHEIAAMAEEIGEIRGMDLAA